MEKEQTERLKKVVLVALPAVLGAMAVKNVHERSQTKHISYWEASRTFLLDLMEDSRERALRVSGTVLHGQGGRGDVLDVELYDGFEYAPGDIERLEEAFGTAPESSDVE